MKLFENQGTALKSAGFFLVINAVGIGLDLKIKASLLDPIRYDKIDPVREWLGTSLPLLAFYFGVNMTWLLMSRKNAVLGMGRLTIWLLVCLTWIIVLAQDPMNLQGFREVLNGTAWP